MPYPKNRPLNAQFKYAMDIRMMQMQLQQQPKGPATKQTNKQNKTNKQTNQTKSPATKQTKQTSKQAAKEYKLDSFMRLETGLYQGCSASAASAHKKTRQTGEQRNKSQGPHTPIQEQFLA